MKKWFAGVDGAIFGGSAAIYAVLFLFIIIAPTAAEKVISDTLSFTFNKVGWVYLLGCTGLFVALLFVAFGPYGKIKLGQAEDKPEYSFVSWMGMLFGAGIGSGLVYFGVNEPMTHFINAPIEAGGSPAAAVDGLRLTFMHWGVHPWALYCAAGLAMAYFQYKRGLPNRISSCFEPMLGRENLDGAVAKVIDIFALVATLCGIATSVGFASTQFAAGISLQYGLPSGFQTIALVILFIGIVSTISAMKGVAKGIKIISDLNMWIVLFFVVFMLIVGSTLFEINILLEAVGSYFNKLPAASLFNDTTGVVEAKAGYDWVSGWTVFYYAWWLAFAPFVGGFLANISKGRTIKEFILACLFAPTVLCFVWFSFFGGTAIDWTLTGKVSQEIIDTLANNSQESLVVFLGQLPFSTITIVISLVFTMTLIITSVNSGAYTMGLMSSGAKQAEPTLALRAFWGTFIALNALLFLWLGGGGMQTLRNTSMVAAFPFLFVLILMFINALRSLHKHYGEVEDCAKLTTANTASANKGA